ncbi:MAG: 2-hydroxyglutaryl-CoA dehydratase [Euryarchaeota archaeon]|nr:2-hydroxyglutaryl-CoA dehydratase [Euryarchaeota archaeon]
MAVAGVDVGAISTKAVVMEGGRVLASGIRPTGLDAAGAALAALEDCCRAAGIQRPRVSPVVVTGNGRKAVPFAQKDVTEIMAFAKGARHLLPAARTAIDLGGQGIRVVVMDERGVLQKFLTNDKCSTGTGCFLDVMAVALQARVEDLGDLALASREHHNISNTCTVFAESEVVSLVARGKTKEDIIAGLLDAMAAKVRTLVNQLGLRREVFFGGGVALNRGAVKALEAALGTPLHVPEEPQTVGALGAALIAGGK